MNTQQQNKVKVNWNITLNDTPLVKQMKFEYMRKQKEMIAWRNFACVMGGIIMGRKALINAWDLSWLWHGRE
ncbi:hypothetical protein LTR56_000731 [Elasticomyces elasticus]|nr:hypothetical protein LTR56_000731 [Elasticomyces elasticus]